ncbi:hypothetical protein JCM9279_001226 [Rhodotorula babjevae]
MTAAPSPTKSGRASPSLYHLDVRQQPRQARMAGSGEKADRRPIDPPPIIRLRIRRPSARKKPAHLLTDDDLATPTLTHTLFMFASLVEEDTEQEMFELHGSKTAVVTGSVVSSLFHLRDQSCFVFPDMSVRMEGRWRFKMSLYEVSEEGAEFRTSILTDVFQVYSSKRFPGMSKSTELSRSFAQQGLKLRIRRPGSSHEDGDELSAPPAPAPAPKKPAPRRKSKDASAEPIPRRPSAPVASTSQQGLGLQPTSQRPWASWDTATGAPDAGSSRQLHTRAALATVPARDLSHGGAVPRPPTLGPPPSASSQAPQTSHSGPQRSASGSYRAHAHPYGPPQPAPAHAYARPFPPPRAHAFAHHALPPSSHSYPSTRPRAHHPLRSHSPPPVLAPLRHHLGAPLSTSSASTASSSRPPSAASTSASSTYTSSHPHPHPHAHHHEPHLRLSPPTLGSSSRPQTQAAESSLRSTDASCAAATSDVDDEGDAPVRPAPARMGSLAMLLGEGRDAKELDGDDGEAMFL